MSTNTDVEAAGVWRRMLKSVPRIRGDRERPFTATMRYLTLRSSLNTILPLIIPGTLEESSINGSVIERYVPLQHPDFSNLYARGFDVEYQWGSIDGCEQATSGPENLAMITVEYETPTWSLTGDEPFLRVSAQGYTRDKPTDNIAFDTGGTPSFDVSRLVPGMRYAVQSFESPNVTAAIEAAWGAASGSVSSDYFRGTAPGYVLFQYPTFEYQYKQDGTKTCSYTLYFDVSRDPWNYEYKRAGTQDLLEVNGLPRYPSIPFSGLFY